MRPGRPIPLAIAGLSLLTLGYSSWSLGQRIEQWNEAEGDPVYYFMSVGLTSFTFAGKPVTITDDINERGEGEVVVTYADETLRIPVAIPNDLPLPGLVRHEGWLRLHVFAEASGMTYPEFADALDAGDITSRLVAVVRTPHAEPTKDGLFDLETEEDWGWGEVRRDRWSFTFHEFLPGGGWNSETLRFPESGKAFYRRQVKADREGLPPPARRSDELEEGSWQFSAAIPLMNRPPSITNEQQALRNAGWTLPVASTSVVTLMLSLAFAFAPKRRRPTDGETTEPAPTKDA